ncbi:MAG: GNAT family N-acetyltransferase [Gemmatimonadales bacterium]
MSDRTITAEIEERLLVPTYASRWSPATIAAHRSLALPFQLVGQVRRWVLPADGELLSVAGIGRKKLIEPIATRLFGELPPASSEPRRMLWSPAALIDSGADLVIVEVHRWMAPRFRRSGWLTIPDAVRWQGDLSQVPPAEPCRSLTEDLRKLKRNGFTITHTTDRREWEMFYSEMVRPQAEFRHGDSAWLPSPRLMAELAHRGTLHLIWQHGLRVAGACSLRQGDTIWLPLSGIRHGDDNLLRQGAGTAVLALPLEWARTQGYRRVDAGRTGPFINHGLQHFKRKWGLSPVPDPLAHVAAVRVTAPAARQAFVRQPVLVEQGSQLGTYAGAVS